MSTTSSAWACNRAGPVGASVVLEDACGKQNCSRGRMQRRRGASVKKAAFFAWRSQRKQILHALLLVWIWGEYLLGGVPW